ncbi:MAG: GAF domain-containing protein [Magnetococcales bacterium]|nr:GAF domain-containing protein [Magnetococcales bacterium]
MKSSNSLKNVISTVFTRVLDILDAEAGSLWLYNQKENQNICHIAEGPARDRVIGLRLPPGTGIVGKTIETKEADVVLDCSTDGRFDANIDKKSNFKTLSMICVPIVDEEEAIGAIQIINKKSGVRGRFTDDDVELVKDLTISASAAVRNARLMESESRVKEMNTLMEISRQMASSLDLNHVMDLVVNLSGNLVEVSFSALALLNDSTGKLFLSSLSGREEVNNKTPWQQSLLTLMESVRLGGRPAHILDVESLRNGGDEAHKSFLEYLDQKGMKSLWASPLADTEGALGVLWLESEIVGFAGGEKADALGILVNQAAVALRNASLYQKIPFVQILKNVGEQGRKWSSGWRKWMLISLTAAGIVLTLHYVPWFRMVSSPCMVEARFGQGIYVRVAGRVKETFVKEGDRVKEGQLVARMDDQPIRVKLVEAESKLAMSERQIIEAKAAGDAGAMSRASIERMTAQATLKQAQIDMQEVEVRSPIDGIILTPRPMELPGREFPLGAEILRVADPSSFTIMVELPEADVLDIHAGQSVRGVLRSRPGQGFRGEIVHVGRNFTVPMEALEKGVVDTKPPEGFSAEVRIIAKDVDLLPGMTGQAFISTPQTSLITRAWRRIVNVVAFWTGLNINMAGSTDKNPEKIALLAGDGNTGGHNIIRSMGR